MHRRILLVEDNRNNQMVAKGLLVQRGYHVEVADNGRLALEALQGRDFDLVLMDIQMPEMDGVEATTAIRSGMPGIDRNMPIIAVTAHAMKGDRERYLAAGMNGYVAKPITRETLFAAIDELQTSGELQTRDALQTGQEANAAATQTAAVHLDPAPIQDLLQLEAGGFFSFREFIELFFAESARRLEALQAAMAAGDAATVRLEAHTLKGSANELGARLLGTIALRLEEAGAAGDLAGAAPDVEALVAELATVHGLLKAEYDWL